MDADAAPFPAADARGTGILLNGEKTLVNKNLVLTVGNGMMGDDAAGPLLAQKLRSDPIENWDVIDGGAVPENCLHKIREISPGRVLVIDASDMDLKPGEIRKIGADRIDDSFLLTTHTLPLSYLIHALEEFVPDVQMVGIQPELIAFGYPLSAVVEQAVEAVYESLKLDNLGWQELH
jgi:hydrogenase 3 maturation protease